MRMLCRYLGVALVAVLFATSALLKLFPAEESSGLLQTQPALGKGIAAFEVLVAILLVHSKYRRYAAVAGSVTMALGAVYLATSARFALPRCGCFGGWVAFPPVVHFALIGVSLFLLADIAFAGTRRPRHAGVPD